MTNVTATAGCRGCRVAGILLLLIASLPAVEAPSDIRETSLTIGRGWAIVHELRPARLAVGDLSIVFDDIPAEADLATLAVRHRRVAIHLRDWERVLTPRASTNPAFRIDGTTVTWSTAPSVNTPTPGEPGPVRCGIHSPVSGERVLQVSYLVTGITWRASYLIALRGEPEESTRPISVDFQGRVRIENRTSREFYDATIHLAGGELPSPVDANAQRGFLMVADETPLSDIWAARAGGSARESIEYEYPIADRVTVSPSSDTGILLSSMTRQPAQRFFAISDLDPGDEESHLAASRQVIAFRNRSTDQQGRHLPAGEVTVYAGGRQPRILQKGTLPHTMADAELRIDLGPEKRVRGGLRRFGMVEVSTSIHEEQFNILVENEFPRDVIVEVAVRPPYRKPWEVDRSSESYERLGKVLRFQPVVSGHSRLDINFRLIVRK